MNSKLKGVFMVLLKAAGAVGSIVALIALVMVFLKTIIGFIAFLTGAIKIFIIVLFVALIIGIGLMVLKGLKETRQNRE